MPTSTTARPGANKRKSETVVVEHDAALVDAVAADTVEAKQKRAALLFQGILKAACPTPTLANSTSGLLSLECLVLDAREIRVSGKGGQVPKRQLVLWLLDANSSAPDLVTTSVKGVAFGFPSRVNEPSPEAVAKDPKARGDVELVVEDGNTCCAALSVFLASFYIDPPGSQAGSNTSAIDSCVPGTRVLVSGVSCVQAKDGDHVFVNAKRVVPLCEPVEPLNTARQLISQAKLTGPSNALLASMAAGNGFFGVDNLDEHLTIQANDLRERWQQLVESCVARLERSVMALSSNEKLCAAINIHIDRMKATKACDVAAGHTSLFRTDLHKDLKTPFVFPVIQAGVTPVSEATEQCSKLFDPSQRDSLPNSFAEFKLVDVQTKGSLMTLAFRPFIVARKSAAITAIDEGCNPILSTRGAAVAVKLSKRSLGPATFGVFSDSKIDFVANALLPVADMVMWTSVFPRAYDDCWLNSFFPSAHAIDMVQVLQAVAIPVRKEWLDEHMLANRGVLIYKCGEFETLVEPSNGCGPAPNLFKNAYQALSEGSFELESLKLPDGKSLEIRVVYEGVLDNVKASPAIVSSTDAGEAHLAEMAAAVDSPLREFLRASVVYAVAV